METISIPSASPTVETGQRGSLLGPFHLCPQTGFRPVAPVVPPKEDAMDELLLFPFRFSHPLAKTCFPKHGNCQVPSPRSQMEDWQGTPSPYVTNNTSGCNICLCIISTPSWVITPRTKRRADSYFCSSSHSDNKHQTNTKTDQLINLFSQLPGIRGSRLENSISEYLLKRGNQITALFASRHLDPLRIPCWPWPALSFSSSLGDAPLLPPGLNGRWWSKVGQELRRGVRLLVCDARIFCFLNLRTWTKPLVLHDSGYSSMNL